VEQHASAKHASVTLRYEPGQVRLSITDDGRGILERAPTELVAANRLGLVGMREQARLIGATIAIGAGSRRGTRIELGLETPAR
jgi:signal transduction histidine kinase